jgi:translocation and assembly module TamB
MGGEIDLRLLASGIPVYDIESMLGTSTGFEGLAMVEMRATGSRGAPVFLLDATIDSLGIADVRLERAVVSARYNNGRVIADLRLDHAGERAVTVAAQIPLDLRLERVATRVLDEPVSGRVTANGVKLAVLEAIFPQVRETVGSFSTNLSVTGTLKRPQLAGPLTVTASQAKLEGLGLQLRGINADIDFRGDSAMIRRFSAGYDGGGAGDTASVSGFLSFREYLDPTFDIRFFANDFRVVQLPRVADLYVNSSLSLAGRYSSSALSGSVNVDRGALYIPELAQKRLVALAEIDSALQASRAFAPPLPSGLLQNLELRNVRVVVGDQVWLRSAESNASIQIGGEVSMTSVRVPRAGSLRDRAGALPGSRADSVYRLALEGTLNADRGEYRLDMGVVQRKFQVEPGGTLTFFGEPELNPTLNISALHTVRGVTGQDAGRDVRIRARLIGSLADYQLVIESADGLDLSASDLISYLVTGSPSFELGAAGDANLRTAASILLPSIGTWVGDRVVGGRFDSFQLDLALGQDERLSDFGQVFKRARVGVGKQLGSRTFLSANTNFCQIGGLLEGQSASTEDLIQSIGLKLERRLNNGFSMALSAEPSTDALRCTATGSSVRRVISSPPQLGFDFFKIWRF